MRRGVEGSHLLSNENSGAMPRYFCIIVLRKPMDKDKIQHKELAAGRWAEMPLAGELIQRDFDMFIPGAKKG